MAHLRSFPPVIISAAEMVWYVENARCCEAQNAINLYGAIIRYGGRGRFVRLRRPLSMLPLLQAPYAGPDELAPPAHTRRRGVGRGRPVDAVRSQCLFADACAARWALSLFVDTGNSKTRVHCEAGR